MKSIFDKSEILEKKLHSTINHYKNFIPIQVLRNPRSIGGSIEEIVIDNFKELMGTPMGL